MLVKNNSEYTLQLFDNINDIELADIVILDRLEEFEDIKGVITYLYSMSCMLMLM